MKTLEIAQLETRPKAVLTLGIMALAVSSIVTLIAFSQIPNETMVISLPGKRSSLDIGEVNAAGFGLASLLLVATSIWWILLTSRAQRVNQFQVIWVPIIALFVVGGFITLLLSLEPATNGWGIAGGAFGTVLYSGAIALLSSIAWKTIRLELIKEELLRNSIITSRGQ